MHKDERRDYFIAHAPEVPAPWFEPSMRPRPIKPMPLKDRKLLEINDQYWDEENGQWWDDEEPKKIVVDDVERDISPGEIQSVINYRVALNTYADEIRNWEIDWKKERIFQWPLAWADEMMRRTEANELCPK